jgi:hypothetical protein
MVVSNPSRSTDVCPCNCEGRRLVQSLFPFEKINKNYKIRIISLINSKEEKTRKSKT